jgi:cobalt-zinc-cadmium efflux system membrane fusion protein
MNRIFSFVIFFAAFFLLSSCKSEKAPDVAGQTDLPPSLKPGNKAISLVRLSEKEQNGLNVETVNVNAGFIDYSVSAPGVVFSAPEHASAISTPINGQISRISKYEGDRVRKGELLFQIQSFEFGNMVSDYLQAYAEEQFQTNRLVRLKQLVKETISSESELERVLAEYQRASVSTKAAYSKLKAVGVTDHEIKQFVQAAEFEPELKIFSPIDGIVEQIFVEQGQSVNALEKLSRVLDPRVVLIRGYHSPDDARLIHTGDSVTISKRENQEILLKAIISSMNPGLDENSRSVVSNILVKTVDGWPKPGENVRIDVVISSQKQIISIPVESLTYDGNQPVVFVQRETGVFEKRPIDVAEIRDKYVFLNSGLSNGEKIAVTKVFSLKALSRFDIIAGE